MNNKKETALQEVINEQVEDKHLMREDRAEVVRIIREQSAQKTASPMLFSGWSIF